MCHNWFRSVLIASLTVPLLVGCQEEPSRWDEVQEQTQGSSAPAVAENSVEGGDLNRFFPTVESPFDIVYKQEKQGFAQASLQKDGTEMLVLSISDTAGSPDAKEKYQDSDQTVDGHPMASAGSKGTAVLVADRYQVQARSMDPSFGEAERIEWLQKCDLKSLSNL